MDIKYTIKDNFLNKADYNNLKMIMLGDNFPWNFHQTVTSYNDQRKSHFFWTHVFFSRTLKISPFFTILNPILKNLEINALIRIKANLYSNQGKIEEHKDHTDYPFKHKTALFSLNTCNGFTMLADNTKIESVGNRILFFDSSQPHHSSTCTNANMRCNININYF
jgi:hypothetical protein